jgi:hypothetical protein
MFARPELRSFLLLFVLALSGCALDAGNGDGTAALDDEGDGDGPYLENEGDDVLQVLPNGMAELSVRYFDAFENALPGVPVEFGLSGPAGGSSLMPASTVTDDEGRARTLLRVGSDPSRFYVRVSADGVEELDIEVRVGEVAGSSVIVEVKYAGERDVQKRTVTALPSVNCEEALAAGVSGELTYTFEGEETVKRFSLGPGLHYSVLAWGRDRTNAKVAEGCAELDAPIEEDGEDQRAPLELEVMLVDTPMNLQGSYALTLDLSVAPSVARVASALETAAVGLLPVTPAPEGDFYLDAVESTLRAGGQAAAADALVERRALSDELDLALQSALDAAAVGVVEYAVELGAACGTFGNRLEVRTTYGSADKDMSVTVDMLRARTSDGSDGLDLSGLITTCRRCGSSSGWAVTARRWSTPSRRVPSPARAARRAATCWRRSSRPTRSSARRAMRAARSWPARARWRACALPARVHSRRSTARTVPSGCAARCSRTSATATGW